MNERGCESVGIDLGTTYSTLAYLDGQMMPRVMCDSSGQAVVPSVVFFDDEEIIVGEMALAQAKVRADRVAQFVKVHMGEPWRKKFQGKVHTPESLSALILGQLIREAEPQIGSVRSAVITVPAYFTEKRRRATQQAGEIAGLRVIGTLNEPMAAMLAYGMHREMTTRNAVVYDLGGGTFDVTVVRISPNELEELATNGNRQLGGRDWDQALIDYVCEDFKKAHRIDPRDHPQVMQDLQIECEHAKRRLGRMAKSAVRFHACGHDHVVELTRQKFEELTAHLLQATKLTTELALEDAGLKWSQIASVVLVGGSTHMPAVRNMLAELSKKPPETGVNPVTAVALGAAIYAQMLESGQAIKTLHDRPAEEIEPVPSSRIPTAKPLSPAEAAQANDVVDAEIMAALPSVSFVTAHGVGVRVLHQQKWINQVLIPKNTKVPTHVTRRFWTTGAVNKKGFISVGITQGDTPDLDLAEELGTGKIEGIPLNEPPGKPVDVTMEFDSQGRLHTRAVYVQTGQQMAMSVEVRGGLKEEEVKAYRQFLESTGFIAPFDADKAIDQMQNLDDDDDDDELDELRPI
jgi:molecular chaperone DnaK